MQYDLSFYRKEDNPYLRAVIDIGDVFISRMENPILQVDFLFNMSSAGRKFYKAVRVAHDVTDKVLVKSYISFVVSFENAIEV